MKNILIAGVGGQGSLLASRLIGEVYLSQGLDVKVSEIHGMSQRGGSVVTYVRADKVVHSPVVPPGEVDVLLALEALEALRWASHVRADGSVVMSTQNILPMPVISGSAAYPDGIEAELLASGRRVLFVDALSLAREAGSVRATNTVMMGAMSHVLDIPLSVWEEVIRRFFPEKILAINEKAFALGRAAVDLK